MLSAFPLAFAQLGEPATRRVLVKSLVVTILFFIAAASLSGWLLIGTNPCGVGPLSGECPIGAGAGTLAAAVFALIGLWLLFPAVAIGVLGFFADEVVEAVERRHYPAAAASGRNPTALRSVAIGARSAGRLVLWNLLGFPFYLLLLVTGIGPFILFFVINAAVLGRDLGEMVAVRHLDPPALRRWLGATRLKRGLLGLAATLLFMIPFVNLLAPVLSAAVATHLFHEGRK
jgi:CysZ protein